MNILKFSELAVDYWEEFLLLRLFILAILLLAVYYILNKLVEWFFKRSNFFDEEVEKTIQGVTRSSLRYGISGLFLIYLIGQFIDLKGILAGAGILGVVIGFAAQQMLKDILLGFVRLSDNEFRVGNFVTFNGTSSGTIEEIGIRFMQIREWSGKLLTIPHSEIRTIQNFNKGRMRIIERITVSYQENPEKVKRLLEDICNICNDKYGESLLRLEDGTPEEDFRYIGITDLNPNLKYVGYELCIVGLVKPDDYFETSRSVRFEMMTALYEHQILMPSSHLLVQGNPNQERLLEN
ncbi:MULTISPECIES: mechanosensitive ion channel family protein [unclassified Bacillus (in: firmicutes)]|uniref:mechanosensitive ion channel family protein n=1 Tax=unclassified Bacillus (in: firmicutes) TaxID=185979 RepID=UPI001BE75BF3|nr:MULTISPECIES: mechanosensitive ion channel family protein [unclassified Bacillus (in: firmicutes)]MBT2616159.1 mechanosensitive ion channel family protein [Bacillus sp. ISL-78]MBT2628935.1 mechanosensitive ion channel family protein [Bacillus sp. ISL-101]MBT2714883.1 mechanosensitive ion channel family protein [Bacillus sp. ISL-57]